MICKALILLNPKAALRDDLRSLLANAENDGAVDIRIPWSAEQMTRDIESYVKAGTARIIAGGGDGTLNGVVNALCRLGLQSEVVTGLLPLGTANDFARGMGDDGSDLAPSLERAMHAPAHRIDLGCINGHYFVNVASGGFGAMITATTPKPLKKRLGGLAYTLNGLARLSELKPKTCRFTLDNERSRELRLRFMAIGNSRYAGGGYDVAPGARLDDGLLDLSVIVSEKMVPPGFFLREWRDPTNPDNEVICNRTFRECLLTTDSPFHLNLDGEPIIDTRFEIRVAPAALKMAF